MRSRMPVRTVASAMSSELTTSVSTSSPWDCSSSRSVTGLASATVAMASAFTTSSSISAW